jgi:hypothetical protein
MRNRRPNFESDDATFTADAYTVRGYRGIAFYVRGWEIEPDEDTEWTGIEPRTGQIVVTMIGDDHRYVVDPADIAPLEREAYCAECGQIGCAHDGRSSDETV